MTKDDLMSLERKIAGFLAFILLSVLLSSCRASDDTMGVDIVGYNHTDHDIGSFYVNDAGGAFEARHEGGGAVCCVSIPRKYKAGMSVTVKWTDEMDEHPQTRMITVPPYTPADGGMFAVHFLRNGEIKVFVTMLAPWHPNYPLKGDEAKM
jgi:hypothetical protein